jgi:amino acid permease
MTTNYSPQIASIVGVAVMQFPLAMHYGGLVTGYIIFLFVGLLSYFGGYYYGLAQRLTGKQGFAEIATEACGWSGKAMAYFSLCGLCWGAQIAYFNTM